SLSRADLSNGYVVTTTSALGTGPTSKEEGLPTGQLCRTPPAPGGATTVLLINKDGTKVLTYPDGVQVTEKAGPDPRFGMMAARVVTRVRTMPGGQTETLHAQPRAPRSEP